MSRWWWWYWWSSSYIIIIVVIVVIVVIVIIIIITIIIIIIIIIIINPRAICQSVKDETLLLQYNPNNTQVFVPKKLKWNEITQGGQWELKDLTLPKPIKPLTTPSKIIQHTNNTIQL